jgi:leucyl-tRNA synthetase
MARQGEADAGKLDRQVQGAALTFNLAGTHDGIDVFTTRPDTLFGASFLAIAADHPLAQSLRLNAPALQAFIAECKKGGTTAAEIETAEKMGFNTNLSVEHPLDPSWHLPVYVANFVLMDYGTGAVFGCPAHDQRDLDFARKYDLPVRRVVAEGDNEDSDFDGDVAYTGPGKIVNSHWMNGMTVDEAKADVIAKAEHEGWGEGQTQYRLRDWGVSPPTLLGHADPDHPLRFLRRSARAALAVASETARRCQLRHSGQPARPPPDLEACEMPQLQGTGARETDTLDTFADSSWYFIRFASQPDDKPFDKAEAEGVAAGGAIYWRDRTCDPASALCPFLDARAAEGRQARFRRALCCAVHAGDGDARDLFRPKG